MIQYYAHVQVNDSFNRQVLLKFLFDWMANSKNKMESLNYQNEDSFIYKENRKILKIEYFKEADTLGIQFTTSDNYKKIQFVVEVMYNIINQTLDLGFYKELKVDSRYIEAISIPNLFVELLDSEYVLPDHSLKILKEPRFLSRKQLSEVYQDLPQLPLIILTKKERCLVNPFSLAKRCFGLAHVICLKTDKQPEIKVHYSNGNWISFPWMKESQLIKACYAEVLNDSVQEHAQSYMFDELLKSRLQEEMSVSTELENYYQVSVQEISQEVEEYRQIQKELMTEMEQLKKKKEKLERDVLALGKDTLFVTNENNPEKKELLLELIKKTLRSLNNNEIYRREDVCASILKENS